jgi:hypothetical protein
MREPRFASENNRPQQPRFETPAQGEPSPESEGWQPLLKAKPPVVAPTREENEQSHQNLVSMTPVMKDAGPAPIPKKYPKPSLDISALRQAINESLKKQKSATDSQEPQP